MKSTRSRWWGALGAGAMSALALGCGGADSEGAKVPAPVAPPASAAPSSAPAAPVRPTTRAPVPPAPVALAEYFKVGRLSLLTFSFDEKRVAYLSDAGGRPDVWVRPLAGGAATQITHVDGFVHSVAFSPADDRLAYETDHGGDELPRLFLTNAKGDAPLEVAPELPAGRRTQFVEWAADGKTLLYLANARDERSLDLYEYDVRTKKSALVWRADGAFAFALASRDHRRFVVVETRSDADNDLYLVERARPDAKTLLTKHAGAVQHDASTFSADGRTLYLTSDEGAENTALYALDVTHPETAIGKKEPLLADRWDVEGAGVSTRGRYLFTVTNVEGSPRLAVTDTVTKLPVALPSPPNGGAWGAADNTRSGPRVLGFSRSDRYLGVVLRSDVAPAVPYVLDLAAGKAMPIGDPLPESLRARAMVTGKVVHVPSFDGREVPAFLYAPSGAGPFPAVIDVHGGPTSQSRRVFSRFTQYLVSKGYVVLVPNVRGSTGYGKTWTRLDNLDLGGGPLKDVVACKTFLAKEAHVDAGRVVVLGGSYGGYMALAAAAFTPDEFAASVDYFGVSDLKSLVESFPPYWASFASYIHQKFGDPKNPAHAAYQHDRSPLYFTDRMKKPLLVVQGERDARVRADQSTRIVSALRTRGVPVHYLPLAGEGHGFSKNENTLRVYQLTDRFLDRYVLGDTSVTVDETAATPPK